ncbi:hypothetical protein MBLNU459_g5350t2 [Dothideomycetes sp. NU459]
MSSLFLLLSLLLIRFAFALPVEVNDIQLSNIKRSFTGPVITSNFPDPCIIKVDGIWYAFATRTYHTTVHYQIATSPDFENWTISTNADGTPKDALPNLPAWVNPTLWATWAPDVNQLDDGTFIMYFTAGAASSTSKKHCVGAATSTTVDGPYTALPNALFCPLSIGGAIDPAGFRDHNGQRYVVYKVDGNSIGHGGACGNAVAPYVGTPIMLQPVAADGITFTGASSALIDNNGDSDQGIVEAPVLIRTRDGTYVLFFSSGCYATSHYTVSYATASNLTGPYTRSATPLMATGDGRGLNSPGGMDIWSDNQHMVFHAYSSAGGRSMYTAMITVSGTTVSKRPLHERSALSRGLWAFVLAALVGGVVLAIKATMFQQDAWTGEGDGEEHGVAKVAEYEQFAHGRSGARRGDRQQRKDKPAGLMR